MAEKRRTIKCKICEQEHMGLICTKFTGVRVLDPVKRKEAVAGLLSAPKAKPAKAKKAKKKKRTKSRTPKQAKPTQPIAPPPENGGAVMDKETDK